MLLVGAATCDVFGEDRRPGGVAAYGARAAAALGVRARILTIAGPGAELAALCGHDVAVVAAARTLTFEHDLEGDDLRRNVRRLRLVERPARALACSDLPPGWSDSQVLVLGPLLADDIDMESFAGLQARWRGLLGQGLQREVGRHGRVRHAPGPSAALLSALDERTTLFVSDEEIAGWDEGALGTVVKATERVVVTRGALGAEVFCGSDSVLVPAPAASSVDTTGGGDVFATAFMIALANGADDAEAGRLAAELAAAAVERVGVAELPRAELGGS